MSDKKFIETYLNDFSSLILPNDELLKKIVDVKEILVKTSMNNGKITIFGNGGSAAIASHVSVDLTKNAKIRSLNFNEADLITCFSNDFGYENWIKMAINYFGDKGDVLIVISSSGKSRNIIKACTAAKKKRFSKIITLTGHSANNSVKKLGDINL